MGIPVNLEESTLVRATIDRVRQESVKNTSIDNIVRVLRSRFQDKLPTDLRERLDRYSQDELDEIVERSATAASAEEALTKPPASSFDR
jgi:Holliday junction resolvasome RuvABC ATP-dependent DNA helicase subunit